MPASNPVQSCFSSVGTLPCYLHASSTHKVGMHVMDSSRSSTQEVKSLPAITTATMSESLVKPVAVRALAPKEAGAEDGDGGNDEDRPVKPCEF